MIVAHAWRRVALLLAAVFIPPILLINHLADTGSTVILEESFRAEVKRDSVTVTVPISRSEKDVEGTVSVELLDETDKVIAQNSVEVRLRQGDNFPSVNVSWSRLGQAADSDSILDLILWTRVRYRFTPNAGAPSSHELTGIRALALMTKELFALSVIAPEESPSGLPARIRIAAEHPLTGLPIPGVRIEARLYPEDLEDEKAAALSINKSGVSGSDGFVAWDFLPPGSRESSLSYKLDVTATLGSLSVKDEREIRFRRDIYSIITTDKKLYQPGQDLHIRALVYNRHSRRPCAAEPVDVEIEDQEYQTVFARQLTTDRFGVAYVDWEIPVTTPLGQYSVEAKSEGEGAIGNTSVRVSR
jgi:MG2 domain-containing protein